MRGPRHSLPPFHPASPLPRATRVELPVRARVPRLGARACCRNALRNCAATVRRTAGHAMPTRVYAARNIYPPRRAAPQVHARQHDRVARRLAAQLAEAHLLNGAQVRDLRLELDDVRLERAHDHVRDAVFDERRRRGQLLPRCPLRPPTLPPLPRLRQRLCRTAHCRAALALHTGRVEDELSVLLEEGAQRAERARANRSISAGHCAPSSPPSASIQAELDASTTPSAGRLVERPSASFTTNSSSWSSRRSTSLGVSSSGTG